MGLPRRISCRVLEKQRCTHYDILLNEGVGPRTRGPQDSQSRGQVDRLSEPPSCSFYYIAAGAVTGGGDREYAKLPAVDSEIGSRSSRKCIVDTGRSRRAVSADVLQLAR